MVKLLWLAIRDVEGKRARERFKERGLPPNQRKAPGYLVEGQTVLSQTIEAFITAVNRHQLGTPQRCPVCDSYQLRAEHVGDGSWMKAGGTCGWEAPAEPAPSATPHDPADENGEAEESGGQSAPEEECVEFRDLAIYLSPDQARAVLEQASSRQPPRASSRSR